MVEEVRGVFHRRRAEAETGAERSYTLLSVQGTASPLLFTGKDSPDSRFFVIELMKECVQEWYRMTPPEHHDCAHPRDVGMYVRLGVRKNHRKHDPSIPNDARVLRRADPEEDGPTVSSTPTTPPTASLDGGLEINDDDSTMLGEAAAAAAVQDNRETEGQTSVIPSSKSMAL